MKSLIGLMFVAIMLFACKKNNQQQSAVCFDGIVHWGGEPAADGLGWVIYSDDSAAPKVYKPFDIPADFKINDTKVAVCLTETDQKFSCFCLQPLPYYLINSIRRR